MDDELIQFEEVTKRFGKNLILDSINLTIPEGKITGIIGASGEGKSTILKLMASFYKPTKGKITYLRRNIYHNKREVSKLFGLSIEDGSFYEKLTVQENLKHFGKLYGIKRKELNKRIDEIIRLVELEHAKSTQARNLSVGMKKRLDIACSLIHDPSVLVLDEPTADLDPLLRKHMLKLIKKINKEDTTIILTTQILSEADIICDKIAILCNQKIVEEGTPAKIKGKYKEKTLNGVFKKIFSKQTIEEREVKKIEESAQSLIEEVKEEEDKW